MDVFVFPTVWDLEGFGLVMIEAMAHKVPVIGNNVKPVSEIIKDNDTGLLTNVTDSTSLAKTVAEIFNNDYKRDQLLRNALQDVKTNYNLEKTAEKFLDIFHRTYYAKEK